MRDDSDTMSPNFEELTLRRATGEIRNLKKRIGWLTAATLVVGVIARFFGVIILQVIRPWEPQAPTMGCPAPTTQPTGK